MATPDRRVISIVGSFTLIMAAFLLLYIFTWSKWISSLHRGNSEDEEVEILDVDWLKRSLNTLLNDFSERGPINILRRHLTPAPFGSVYLSRRHHAKESCCISKRRKCLICSLSLDR